MSRIENIEEFSKLFKINIPMNEHFDYYIDTLSKCDQYSNIHSLVSDFSDLEKYVEKLGYSSVKSYKLDFALPKLIKYIEESESYGKLKNLSSLADFKLVGKDEISKIASSQFYYISFDISKANYSILKFLFDKKNELLNSWEELCGSLEIHNTLIKSKSFRQLVFGNINPKRFQKLQHSEIMNAINYLKLNGLSEENFAFISHDEFVLRFKKEDFNDTLLMREYLKDSFIKVISDNMSGLPIRRTVYEVEKIGKNSHVKIILEVDNETISNSYKNNRIIQGVPGNKFYKYFKLHVLKSALDDRDLLFINDGEIASWAIKEDTIESSRVPEGELTFEEVSTEYGYFLEKLSKEFPYLSNSQKRRIINLSTSLCKSCMNASTSCRCWDDE